MRSSVPSTARTLWSVVFPRMITIVPWRGTTSLWWPNSRRTSAQPKQVIKPPLHSLVAPVANEQPVVRKDLGLAAWDLIEIDDGGRSVAVVVPAILASRRSHVDVARSHGVIDRHESPTAGAIERLLNSLGEIVNLGKGIGDDEPIDHLVTKRSLAHSSFDEREATGAVELEH